MGIKAARRKLIPTIAVAAALVLALAAIPAYALYYVHSEDHTAADNGSGVYEVTLTLNEEATNGSVRTGLVFVHEGDTAADAIEEGLESSENQNGLDAIHNYDYESLADYLQDKTYTVKVYHAEDQQPGTHTTYDSDGVEGTDIQLQRFDSVVVTVTKD